MGEGIPEGVDLEDRSFVRFQVLGIRPVDAAVQTIDLTILPKIGKLLAPRAPGANAVPLDP
jgi:hypothetical protein